MTSSPNELVPPLIDWYRQRARTLPWRADPSPYHVLLSELMCQQTRVETALPYFERFVAKWPTVELLAAAEPEDVLHAWAGLGYYSRARNLHACAIAASEAGGVPSTVDALSRLPGIGPYTAGAIASIAFGRSAAAVDGNVERVLSRVDRGPEAPWATAGKRDLAARSLGLHEGRRLGDHAGELTQALMELGATVCTPTSPTCDTCPIRSGCAANHHDEVLDWPRRRPRKAPTPIAAAVALIEQDGCTLMGQRPASGLLAGLWEPVMVPIDPTEDPATLLAAGVHARTGLTIQLGSRLGTVTHVFSHRKLTATVFRGFPGAGVLRPDPTAYEALTWARTPSSLALSTLAKKLLALGEAPPLLLAADASPGTSFR
jgi:A/G-specific adenine glycosylase